MRLTTLARKINMTPKQLISFLNEKGVEIENGLHGKLEKEIASMVLDHFSVAEEDESLLSEPIELEEKELEIESPAEAKVVDTDEAIKTETTEGSTFEPEVGEAGHNGIEAEEVELNVGTVEDLESEEFEKIDLIKVRKVKLEGIKVVGKIDLPEKPKKETPGTEQNEVAEVEKPEQKSEKSPAKSKNLDRGKRKNRHGKSRTPLTYDEKVKEEEREKLKKRRRRENAEKRRKIKYYQEHIQPKSSQKSKKKKGKTQELEDRPPEKDIAKYKNPLKRFWAWLNGEYDKY